MVVSIEIATFGGVCPVIGTGWKLSNGNCTPYIELQPLICSQVLGA